MREHPALGRYFIPQLHAQWHKGPGGGVTYQHHEDNECHKPLMTVAWTTVVKKDYGKQLCSPVYLFGVSWRISIASQQIPMMAQSIYLFIRV